jgi:uncharacterized protein (TIGR01777 family)
VSSLIKDGHDVFVLTRDRGRITDLHGSAHLAEWDGRTAKGWGELVDGADAIVNLAGENLSGGRWTAARKQRLRSSRVLAGAAVVEAVQKAAQKPKVVIQSSGVNYYGVRGSEPVPESEPPGDDFLARVCIDWEASTAPVEALSVRRAIIRSGVVLSPKGGVMPLFRLPFRLFVGGPLGSGRQILSWIHMADEVGAIRFLIDNQDASGAYNLVAPSLVSMKEFTRTLGKAMGRPSWFPVPSFALRLVLGEMAIIVLEGQRAVPKRLQEGGYKFRFPEAGAAFRDLLRS